MIKTYLSIDDIKPAYNFGLDRASPAGRTELIPNFPSPAGIKWVVDKLKDVDKACFSGYCFLPGFGALQHLDMFWVTVLDLNCSANLGYFITGLLREIADVLLKTLNINQTQAQSQRGYAGNEKIECFLALHRGLEEIIFTNLGKDRSCWPAILAQGNWLRTLKLHESYVKDSDASETRRRIAEGEDMGRIRQACPPLRQLVIN